MILSSKAMPYNPAALTRFAFYDQLFSDFSTQALHSFLKVSREYLAKWRRQRGGGVSCRQTI
jgi:hypothetical protein